MELQGRFFTAPRQSFFLFGPRGTGKSTAPSRAALYDRAARVVGRFPDRRGARDLSSKHDRYLDEAYE